MPLRRAVAIAFVVTAFTISAENQGGSALSVRVVPERYLDIPVVQLSFPVTNPGVVERSEAVAVTAWARALPGQEIRLMAKPVLIGPQGTAPTDAIQWKGSMERASGGATGALCGSGRFGSGASEQLIRNWTQSGIAKCAFTFALQTQADWPKGAYLAEISLTLETR